MQNESNNSKFINDWDEPLREAVEHVCSRDVPHDHLNVCLDRVISSLPVDDRSHVPMATEPRAENLGRWVFGIATVAAVTLLLVVYFGSTSVSLADVAQAVSRKTWIHVKLHGTTGKIIFHEEVRYSPIHDVSSTRRKEGIRFNGYKLKHYYFYDLAAGILYCVPDTAESRQRPLSEIVEALPQPLADDDIRDDPLPKLTSLGNQRDSLTVVNQEPQKIKKGGRE